MIGRIATIALAGAVAVFGPVGAAIAVGESADDSDRDVVVFKREEIDSWMGTSRVEPVDAEKVRMEVDQLISRERKQGRPRGLEAT